MWVLTSHGAYMPSLRYPKDIAKGDNRDMQIRARREIDLMRLKALYMPNMGPIVRDAGTDYEVRVYCTKEEWADVVRAMTMAIDYQSFKNTTERYKDTKLHTAYLRIWNALYDTLGTRRAFDVKYTRSTYRAGKKGRKGRTTTERMDVLLFERENDGKQWWNEVMPIDVNDKNWE